jgi:hypothetical protein
MDPFRHSALARLIDVRYASNRFVVIASVLGGITAFGYRWITDGDDPFLWALRVGAAMFLGWAITRELDPDHPLSAGIAAIAAGAMVGFGTLEIGAAAGFLIAVRIAARTTGMSAHPWELALVVGFAGYLAASQASWPAAVILLAALWVDGGHEYRPHPPARIAAVAGAFVVIAVAVFTFPAEIAGTRSGLSTAFLVSGGLAAWVAVARLATPTATCDRERKPLARGRIAQARILAGAGVVLAAVITPLDAAAYGPLLAAVFAVAAVSLTKRPRTLANPTNEDSPLTAA